MALFTEQAVRENLRVKDGKRVFFLAEGDRLTPSAREWLRQEHIDILPAEAAKPTEYKTVFGASLTQKPEHMTHLAGNILVMKDHPRIRFRGMVDALEAELLLTMAQAGEGELRKQLEEILQFVRSLIPCDVLGEAVNLQSLCGMTESEIRTHSHFPQKYYDQPHFMPHGRESLLLLQLNKLRTLVRQTELAAFSAFCPNEFTPGREDILMALNRLSSLIYILMIRLKAKEKQHE